MLILSRWLGVLGLPVYSAGWLSLANLTKLSTLRRLVKLLNREMLLSNSTGVLLRGYWASSKATRASRTISVDSIA
jgi:hypothetical protein